MRITNAAAIIAAIGICGVAAAQSSRDYYPNGITLRGGVAIPIDSKLTNVASTLADIGLEYQLPQPLISNGDSFLSIDYFFQGWGNGGNGTVLPVMINQRMYTSAAESRSYWFVGLGVAFMNVNGTGTAVAGRVGVGQELGKAVVAEIAAYISDKAGGGRANSVTFNLGYRF